MKGFLYTLNAVFRLLCLCSLVVGLLACGQSASEDTTQTTTISGNAVKGVLANGIVRAFAVDPITHSRTALGSTQTNEFGAFSLSIDSRDQDKLILLEFEADADSLMTCDVLTGCQNRVDGGLYSFGQTMPLSEDFLMLGFAQDNRAYLSPLSHLLASTANNLPGGLNQENIQFVSQLISNTFQLENSVLEIETADLTNFEALSQVGTSALTHALWSASFFDLSQSDAWVNQEITLETIPLDDLLETMQTQIDRLAEQLTDNGNLKHISHINTMQVDITTLNAKVANQELIFFHEPLAKAVDEGEPLTLSVLAHQSDSSLEYQWYKDDNAISGATSNTYHLASTSLSDQGTYWVEVSSNNTTQDSAQVFVAVNDVKQPLQIHSEPASQYVQDGGTFTLSVSASGDGKLSYQWQKDASIIPGATEATLTVNSASESDEGTYRVLISDTYDNALSSGAIITINEHITPVSISAQPESISVNETSSASFSVTALGGGFLRYQWLKDGEALLSETEPTLTLSNVDQSSAGQYSVIVSNSQSTLTSEIVSLTVISNVIPLQITQQPMNKVELPGNAARFEIQTAYGQGTVQYQWFFNDTEITGATSSQYTVESVSEADEGNYYVVVQDERDTLSSASASLILEDRRELQLSWGIPTQRENGDSLNVSDIGGYVLEYGYSRDALTEVAHINSPTTTQYTITDLLPGYLYLRIATVDAENIQGTFSSIVAINIP